MFTPVPHRQHNRADVVQLQASLVHISPTSWPPPNTGPIHRERCSRGVDLRDKPRKSTGCKPRHPVSRASGCHLSSVEQELSCMAGQLSTLCHGRTAFTVSSLMIGYPGRLWLPVPFMLGKGTLPIWSKMPPHVKDGASMVSGGQRPPELGEVQRMRAVTSWHGVLRCKYLAGDFELRYPDGGRLQHHESER